MIYGWHLCCKHPGNEDSVQGINTMPDHGTGIPQPQPRYCIILHSLRNPDLVQQMSGVSNVIRNSLSPCAHFSGSHGVCPAPINKRSGTDERNSCKLKGFQPYHMHMHGRSALKIYGNQGLPVRAFAKVFLLYASRHPQEQSCGVIHICSHH